MGDKLDYRYLFTPLIYPSSTLYGLLFLPSILLLHPLTFSPRLYLTIQSTIYTSSFSFLFTYSLTPPNTHYTSHSLSFLRKEPKDLINFLDNYYLNNIYVQTSSKSRYDIHSTF